MFPSVYVIIDAVLLRTLPAASARRGKERQVEHELELLIATMLAEAGIKLIQYRNKQASSREYFLASSSLAEFCTELGVRLVVNDRAEIAALAGAGGVHVGQQDLSVEQARRLCGADVWVGVSTHNLSQVRAAAQTSADYIAVGPVFPTQTKERPDPVVGCKLIREARLLTEKPLVAIGGITLERANEVYEAGADALAVAGDILRAGDPAERAREYLALVQPG